MLPRSVRHQHRRPAASCNFRAAVPRGAAPKCDLGHTNCSLGTVEAREPSAIAIAGSGTVGARAHLRGQCVKSGLPWIVSRAAANAAGGSPQPTEPLACQVGVLQDVHHGPSHLAVASGPAAAEHRARGFVTKGPTHSTMQSSEGKMCGRSPFLPGSTW